LFLSETLASICEQSLTNWELLAINDHSSDNTLELLREQEMKDSRIKVFTNTGRGILPALKLALQYSQGTFITRMDADDLMPRDKLELMLNIAESSPNKTIVTGLVSYFSSDQVSEGYQRYEKWLNAINFGQLQWENIYRECVVASPNWMMRTQDLLNIGGFDDLIYPEDYHLTFKWYQHNFTVSVIPRVTHLWREHPWRTSRTSSHYDQEHFFDLKINEFLKHEWNRQPIVLWGKNEKSRLTSIILDQQGIPFHSMDLADYQNLENHPESQLLVAVYPEEKQKIHLESYLDAIDRTQGKDWWYL
jgi:glycosyltransferase involved in cell wall biosynthesis